MPVKTFCFILFFYTLLFISNSFGQFRFVHLSDIHVSDADSWVNNSDLNGQAFSQMASMICNMNPAPAFVVASGDISNIGQQGNGKYHVLSQWLYPFALTNPPHGIYTMDQAGQIPFYMVTGNHDYYYSITPPLSNTYADNFSIHAAPVNDFAFVHGNAVILLMNSGYEQFRPLWVDYNITCPEGSGFSTAQLLWLDSVALAHPEKRKIVVMHHPAVNVNGTNSDGSPNTSTILDPADGCIINNRLAFLDLCDQHGIDMTLSGHVHQNVVASRYGQVVAENWNGGTRYIQTGACLYGVYRVITVDSNFVYADPPQNLLTTQVSETNHALTSLQATYNKSLQQMQIKISGTLEEKIKLSLMNLCGMEVAFMTADISGETTLEFQTGQLSEGIYILNCQSKRCSETLKIAVY